jgi:hypothetical protein
MTIRLKHVGMAIFALGGVVMGHGIFALVFDHEKSGLIWLGLGLAWVALWLGIRAHALRGSTGH